MQLSFRNLRASVAVRQQQHRHAVSRQALCRGTSHDAAKTSATVKLEVSKHVHFGTDIAVVGSVPALGQWKAGGVVPLAWNEGDVWRAELSLPTGVPIEYKYVCIRHNKEEEPSQPTLEWQEGSNLTLNLPAGTTSASIVDSWETGHVTVGLLPAAAAPAKVPQAEEAGKEVVSNIVNAPASKATPAAAPAAAAVKKVVDAAAAASSSTPATTPLAAASAAAGKEADSLPSAAPAPAETLMAAMPSASPVAPNEASPWQGKVASTEVPVNSAFASNVVPLTSSADLEDPWAPQGGSGNDNVVKSTKASKSAAKNSKASKTAKASKAAGKEAGQLADASAAPTESAPMSNIVPGPLSKAPASKTAVKGETAEAR